MRNLAVLSFVNFLWAIQFPASRIATQELGPLTLTWFAMLAATLLVAFWIPAERRAGNFQVPSWGVWISSVVAVGLAGSLVAQLCLNWGLERSLASNAAVLNLATPVLMALFASAFLGERMNNIRWVAFAISLVGVVLVSDLDWSSMDFTGNQYLFGNMLLFMSCAGGAFYNVFSKRLLAWMGPAELLVLSFAVSLIAMFPALLYYEPGSLARIWTASTPSLVSLAVVAVFSLALSMLLYFATLQNVDAMQASLSIYLLPVFGVVLSAITLGERMKPSLLAGGLLVAAGAWLVTVYEERQRRVAH